MPYSRFNNNEVVEKVPQGLRLEPPENTPAPVAKFMLRCWSESIKFYIFSY